MNRLDVTRFGFAVGASLTLLYVGCVFVMATAPKAAAVRFFNSLFHGLDVGPIMRWDMPWTEMVIGVFETFIFSESLTRCGERFVKEPVGFDV